MVVDDKNWILLRDTLHEPPHCIAELAQFVKCSSSEDECIEIEILKELKKAISKAVKLFQGRIYLFLTDNIWLQNVIPPSLMQMLKKIVL